MEQIERAPVEMAVAKLAILMVRGLVGEDGDSTPEHRLVYYAALIGTLEGRPQNVSKLAEGAGMSRATVRRRLTDLLKSGAVVKLDNLTYGVSSEYANSPRTQAHSAAAVAAIKGTCAAIERYESGQSGQ